jgi:hypothetical protein
VLTVTRRKRRRTRCFPTVGKECEDRL